MEEDEITNILDPIQTVIVKYKDHQSIKKIKGRSYEKDSFSFCYTNMEEVATEIRSLNHSTGCPINSLPTTIIKENCDIFTMKVSIDSNNTVIHSFHYESKHRLQ